MATGRDDEIDKLLAQLAEGKKTACSPLAIRFKPAVRDFITLMSGRLGISSAELVNLLVEGVLRETLTPRQSSVTRIPERFWLLMDEHKLTATEVACFLSDWKINLSVLESRERTMDCLTSPLLQKLSEWFYISVEWLEGTASQPIHHLTVFNDWFEAARILKKRIRESDPGNILTRPEIFLAKEMDMNGHELEDTFIFIRRYHVINDIKIRVVECIGYCSTAGYLRKQYESFLSMCGLLYKAEAIFQSDTYLASGQILNILRTGEALPISVLRKIKALRRNAEGIYSQSMWNSSEQIPYLLPDRFINDERRKITEDIITAKPE